MVMIKVDLIKNVRQRISTEDKVRAIISIKSTTRARFLYAVPESTLPCEGMVQARFFLFVNSFGMLSRKTLKSENMIYHYLN